MGTLPRIDSTASSDPRKTWSYYVVYSRYANKLRAFGLVLGRYRELTLPDRRLWLPEADIGIGVWPGRFEGIEGEWLRCYDERS